ncbi:response regulator transcription factor, partial [Phaeodactylibacter luteus]
GRELGDAYKVTLAANGQQAWELLNGPAQDIDLVVSDVMMPLMDGFTLLQKARQHPQLGYTPFLLLTALSSADDELKALRLGVDAFVKKPYSKAELKARIENLLGQQQAGRAARMARTENVVAKTEDSPSLIAQEKRLEPYDERWMQELQQVIGERMHDPDFTVSMLAVVLHISDRTLFNRLKFYTGQTPSQYLRNARLDQAMVLLSKREYRTVKEVCHAVGLKDPRHFTILFKKRFGTVPTSYLKGSA